MGTWLWAALGCLAEPEDAACLEFAGRPAGWDEATHGEGAPDYEAVFDEARAREMTLRVDPSDWATLLAPDEDLTIAADVAVDGATWCGVGVRLKGNSSLRGALQAGVGKLPLHLDFDEYEDTRPELRDQRFFGFEELGLGNGFHDATLLREVLAAQILAEHGVPAARAAWWWVSVDAGEGPAPLGLYTAVEAVDDTLIARAFGDDDGALYEADGACATLVCYDAESFGVDAAPEVQGLQAALVSPAPTWRAGVEARLDVPAFLRWLAVNTALKNGDTYGGAPHNYFLYAPPGEPLAWIPWDHNEILADYVAGPQDPLLADVDARWPLIRRLLDEPDLAARFQADLDEVTGGALADAAFATRVEGLAAFVADELYVSGLGETPGETFVGGPEEHAAAVEELIGYAAAWRARVRAALEEGPLSR